MEYDKDGKPIVGWANRRGYLISAQGKAQFGHELKGALDEYSIPLVAGRMV